MSKIKIRREKRGSLLFSDLDGTKIRLNKKNPAEITSEFLESDLGKDFLLRGEFKLFAKQETSEPVKQPEKVSESAKVEETKAADSKETKKESEKKEKAEAPKKQDKKSEEKKNDK